MAARRHAPRRASGGRWVGWAARRWVMAADPAQR
jgi:hypothetical protein